MNFMFDLIVLLAGFDGQRQLDQAERFDPGAGF